MADDTPRDTAHDGHMRVDAALMRELAQLIKDTDLSEIEVEDGHRKIRVARQITAAPVYQQAVAAPSAATAPAPSAAAPVEAAPVDDAAGATRSPMVGTAYLAPEPGAASFKTVGDAVKAGDTIAIIEAMKVMNAIPAPHAGTLKRVFIENGQPVEFDQPLFLIA